MKKRPDGWAAGAIRIINYGHNSQDDSHCQEKSDIGRNFLDNQELPLIANAAKEMALIWRAML